MKKNNYRQNLKDFINFLKKNKCFIEFKYRFENDRIYKSAYSHPTNPYRYFQFEDKNGYMSNAFRWSPFDYWSDLNRKWRGWAKIL